MACSAELHHQHASSSLKLSLVLLMILWIHVLLAHARTHHHHHHHHHHTHHVPRVWMEKLPFTPMPDFIQEWNSPMEPKTIREFLRFIKKHKLSSHSPKFCHDAGMECEEDHVEESSMPSFQNNDELGSISKSYFQKSDVVVGETISFQGMANNLPFRAFPPHKLAKKLPFSSSSLPQLLNMLGIPSDSNVAKDMEETVRLCERGRKKGRRCVKSMEEMVGFVADKLGSELEIGRTTVPSMEEGEKVVVREIALKGSAGQKSIVCNETVFPYMVLQCSELEEVESIEVMVEREGKETYKGVMYCEKTSCEWRSGREVVFVSKEKRWVAEEEMEKKDGYEAIDDEEDAAKKKKEGQKLKKDNTWIEEEMEDKRKEKKDDEILKEIDEEKEGSEGEKEEGDEKEKSEEEMKKMLKGDDEEIDDHNEP